MNKLCTWLVLVVCIATKEADWDAMGYQIVACNEVGVSCQRSVTEVDRGAMDC